MKRGEGGGLRCAFFHPDNVNIKPIISPLLHPPTLHPFLPPRLDHFNMSSRMYSLEDLVRKASTEVSNLSNELEAVKTEVHKTNFNDSPDKINTFLQKAGVWSEKLE